MGDRVLQALYEKNGSKPSAFELKKALALEGVTLGHIKACSATLRFTPREKPLRKPSPQTSSRIKALQKNIQKENAERLARTYGGQLEASRNAPRRTPPRAIKFNNYDEVLQALYEKNWSPKYGWPRLQPKDLMAALAPKGVKINVIEATHAVRRFTPVKTLLNRPHQPTHPSIRALGLKLQEEKARPGYGQYHQRRRMPAASTDNYVKRMQDKIMQKRAEILARHPEYATWKEYLAKEQAKADKLQGQYRQRRRMPDRRTPSPQTSSAINAIHMK